MKNVFEKIVKETKEKIEKCTNALKKAGFKDKDIQECMDICNLNNQLICEDPKINSDNGYAKGLYIGAKKQLEHIIDILIKNKIYSIIANNSINSHDIYEAIRMLYNVEKINYEVITLADAYDKNIAVSYEKRFNDYTETYYIVARKDKFDKYYEYLMINSDGLHQDYKPTESEMKLFK